MKLAISLLLLGCFIAIITGICFKNKIDSICESYIVDDLIYADLKRKCNNLISIGICGSILLSLINFFL